MSLVSDNVEKWAALADWLNGQLVLRSWSIRRLAREAGVSHTLVARMANGEGPFDATSLNALADALGVPREEVQRLAGLLRDPARPGDDIQALVRQLQAMPEDLRRDTLALFNALLNYRRRAAPTAADRLEAFRAAFAVLSDAEQDEALEELRALLGDAPAGDPATGR